MASVERVPCQTRTQALSLSVNQPKVKRVAVDVRRTVGSLGLGVRSWRSLAFLAARRLSFAVAICICDVSRINRATDGTHTFGFRFRGSGFCFHICRVRCLRVVADELPTLTSIEFVDFLTHRVCRRGSLVNGTPKTVLSYSSSRDPTDRVYGPLQVLQTRILVRVVASGERDDVPSVNTLVNISFISLSPIASALTMTGNRV